MSQSLSQKLDVLSEEGILQSELPAEMTDNLSSRILLRPYQIEALQRWIYYIEKYSGRHPKPHLLFHMATGSGKTVLMAALILNLYMRGYRNFLFFVNSSQIIEKTRDNFLNQVSPKHLFNNPIRIDGKPVNVQSVDTFQAVSSDAINIHFTTIQGLHIRMNTPKEDSITMEDFREYKIVMISDEAHHLNAETKKNRTQTEINQINSWEHTVTNIFRQHSENLLLEFTATADLNHSAIREKYHDKILYDYQLKDFKQDGYSKDIELRQADLPPLDRMIQAMVLSQYRRKVAESHGIHCKPVILMKSKTIAKSSENERLFTSEVKKLSGTDLLEMRNSLSSEDKTLVQAFKYIIDEHGVDYDEFALELQGDFGDGKVVNVNKPKDLEELQIDLNNLEDHSNDLRVIFAVNKLDEGWDVLNLFDIVRLYNTRDSKGDKIGRTTMSEAQLIGRGARYFPFIDPSQPEAIPEIRKYDRDLKHPLRILEELYYHCSHNPRYIDEIKKALIKIGMEDDNTREVNLRLKESFKKSQFYQIGYVWINKRVKNLNEGVTKLDDYKIDNYFTYSILNTGHVEETSAFSDEIPESKTFIETPVSRELQLSEFNRHILNFAMDSNEFFHFSNVKKYFPHITSISEFQTSKSCLGCVKVQVRGLKRDLDNMSPKEKLKIVRYILSQIEENIKRESVEFVGTTEFTSLKVRECFTDKKIKIRTEGEAGLSWEKSNIDGLNLFNPIDEDWYAYDENYGTDQEKYFVQFLNDQSDSLNKRYDEFYLLRNLKAIKLFSFKDGKGFEPDFILFLRKKGEDVGKVLQLFIEPKGRHLIENDDWKQNFLKDIEWEDQIEAIGEGNEYRVYGLPFFNNEHQNRSEFKDAFQQLLNG